MAKKITITVEANFLLILRGRTSGRAWCEQCAAETEVVAVEKPSASNRPEEAPEVWLTSGDLHRLPSTDGSTLVCLRSLLTRVRKPNPS